MSNGGLEPRAATAPLVAFLRSDGSDRPEEKEHDASRTTVAKSGEEAAADANDAPPLPPLLPPPHPPPTTRSCASMENVRIANENLSTALRRRDVDYRTHSDLLSLAERSLERRHRNLELRARENAQVYGDPSASDDDVVEINAGGRIVAVRRGTLCLCRSRDDDDSNNINNDNSSNRLAALFSGRWDRRLQRDDKGRAFLDVNPEAFRALADYLVDAATMSSSGPGCSPPDPPSVEEEYGEELRRLMELFGMTTVDVAVAGDRRGDRTSRRRTTTTTSTTTTTTGDDDDDAASWESEIIGRSPAGCANVLREWLRDDDKSESSSPSSSSSSDRKRFELLYRSSRDGPSTRDFHGRCDRRGETVTLIETTDRLVVGGYSDRPWDEDTGMFGTAWRSSSRAFLFVLSDRRRRGGGMCCRPTKLGLRKNEYDDDDDDSYDGRNIDKEPHHQAIQNSKFKGPTFGHGAPSRSFGGNVGHDLTVEGGNVHLNIGGTYEAHPSPATKNVTHRIKEMEVFRVVSCEEERRRNDHNDDASSRETNGIEETDSFSPDVNDALNAKLRALKDAEEQLSRLEREFDEEEEFIESFACGDDGDVISLNIGGTILTTRRETLHAVEDSVLARRFDGATWTDAGQGAASASVAEPRSARDWSPDEVRAWIEKLADVPNAVASVFEANGITGREMLALGIEGLRSLGVERTGTACLLREEIGRLERADAGRTAAAAPPFLEHSPYCFGKILDYLRWKRRMGDAPLPRPIVRESERGRFAKTVNYFFPGESAKLILG